MVLKEHLAILESLRPYYVQPMAILGDVQYNANFEFGPHVTIDINGNANITHDLTKPLDMRFNCVYNIALG